MVLSVFSALISNAQTINGLPSNGGSLRADSPIDLTLKSYYVKVDGTGDGTSWETAMSGEDFAYVLPKAVEGATFYVAEGTYKPVYDQYGRETSINKDKCFLINNSVSLKGGFSKNSVMGSFSDPSKYKTVFSGDILGDDEIKEVPVNKDWTESLTETGFTKIECQISWTENTSRLFYIKSGTDFSFEGVTFQNTIYDAIYSDASNLKLTLNNSVITYTGWGLELYGKNTDLEVQNTNFIRNFNHAIVISSAGDVVLSSTTFQENQKREEITVGVIEITGYDKNSKVVMDNLTYKDNLCYLTFADVDLLIRNSIFKNNGYLNGADHLMRFQSINVLIEDSKFIDNVSDNLCFF